MKIKLVVPNKIFPKWKVTIGASHGKHRNSAVTAYQLVERALVPFLTHGLKDKTCIEVDYGHHTHNETLSSLDPRYLLYTLSCFMEDYLEPSFLAERGKRYIKDFILYEPKNA